MPIELTEPIVTALQKRLEEELTATIEAINTAASDGYTLSTPTILDYLPPPSDRLEPPVIGIGDSPSRFEDDTGASVTGRHELLIVVYDQAGDQRALAWQLRRWSQAIARIALSGRKLGEAAWGTGLSMVVPGPTLVDDPDNPREWLSWVGVKIWAKRDEE